MKYFNILSNIDLSIADSGLDLADILFNSLINFIGLYEPIKTDEKTKKKILDLFMIKDDEANESNIN